MSLQRVVAEIKKHRKFLIAVHTNPEGDALGSELAFAHLLKKLGKQALVLNEDGVPEEYQFLPEKESVKLYKQNIKDIDFDCMVVLDCSDLERTGEVYRVNRFNKPVINIDHHVSNDNFGSVNWVEPEASSASEMVFRIYKKMGVPFDKASAILLYVGMMTDTGSFRYTNTSGFTHQAVGELMNFGFNVRLIYKSIYEDIPFEELRVLAKILPRIKKAADGKIVWVEIPRSLLGRKRLSFDLTENVLSYCRQVKGAQVVVLFKENFGVKDEIRFNLRSSGLVDVNKVAQYFGGGGHKAAAGCTMLGKLSQVRRKVLAKIIQELK